MTTASARRQQLLRVSRRSRLFSWRRDKMRKQQRAIDKLRRWDEMNHDIMVNIIQRLRWKELALSVCLVCRSWLAALLDSLFPPGNILDLRPIDSIREHCFRIRYCNYLKLVLDRRPTTFWSKLYLPKAILHETAYQYIAKRSPSLHYLNVPDELNVSIVSLMPLVPCWKNLRKVHFRACLVSRLSFHCKYIYHLDLKGIIGDHISSRIAKMFPLLKRLLIRSCVLSMDALACILDGHKNLELLDTKHCYRVYQNELRMYCTEFVKAKEWNEEEIQQKAADLNLHIQCARKHCPKCSHLY